MRITAVFRAYFAIAFLLLSTAVHADPFNNSAQTASGFGAVGAAQQSAIQGLQDQVLSSGIEGSGAVIFPSGRVRKTWHDGYTGKVPPLNPPRLPQQSNPYDASEESLLATAFTTLPNEYFGGKIRLGGFIGYDHLHVNMKPVFFTVNIEDTYDPSRADNQSLLFGGYALYSSANNYFMTTLAGSIGETDQKISCIPTNSDPFECFGKPPFKSLSYDTQGIVASFVGGHVVDMSGLGLSSSPVKLDLRAGTSATYMKGSRFIDAEGALNRPTLDTWRSFFAATLFAVIEDSQTGAITRPYVKGEFRNNLSFKLNNHVVDDSFCLSGCSIPYWQKSDMFVGEVGFDYATKGYTLNAAFYGEAASDQKTVGGRIGVTFQTDAAPSSKAASPTTKRAPSRAEARNEASDPGWSGSYAGFNGGYGWSADDGLVTARLFTTTLEESRSFGSRGAFGGVQLGHNWTLGNVVFGVEGDLEGVHIHGSGSAVVSNGPDGNRVKAETDPDWFGTLRGRVGYSFDKTLFFATGGLAFGAMENRISRKQQDDNDPQVSVEHKSKVGYVIGGGIEQYFARGWSLKAEYQYLDFGHSSMAIVDRSIGPFPSVAHHAEFDHSFHTFRLGLNYHLSSER
jgi:outer membrane immunogenic protein